MPMSSVVYDFNLDNAKSKLREILQARNFDVAVDFGCRLLPMLRTGLRLRCMDAPSGYRW